MLDSQSIAILLPLVLTDELAHVPPRYIVGSTLKRSQVMQLFAQSYPPPPLHQTFTTLLMLFLKKWKNY